MGSCWSCWETRSWLFFTSCIFFSSFISFRAGRVDFFLHIPRKSFFIYKKPNSGSVSAIFPINVALAVLNNSVKFWSLISLHVGGTIFYTLWLSNLQRWNYIFFYCLAKEARKLSLLLKSFLGFLYDMYFFGSLISFPTGRVDFCMQIIQKYIFFNINNPIPVLSIINKLLQL